MEEKKKKSNLFVIICIAVAVIIAAAAVIYSLWPKGDDTYIGNSISNISNGGFVVRDEANKTTYYSAYALYGQKDGAEAYKISDDYAKSLLLYDGKIYYANFGDLNRPYVIDTTEGSVGSCITTDAYVDCMCIYKGRIYYCCNSMMDEEGIYSMNLDGSDKQKILDTIAASMFVYRDHIYYINMDDGNKVYRMSLSDGTLLRVTGAYTFSPVVDTKTGTMYYGNRFGLFSLDFSGERQKEYCQQLTRAIAIDKNDDLIAYLSDELGGEYKGLYRIKNGEYTQIAGGEITWVATAGDMIYFKSTENMGFNTVRCKLDGSEMELVHTSLDEEE